MICVGACVWLCEYKNGDFEEFLGELIAEAP